MFVVFTPRDIEQAVIPVKATPEKKINALQNNLKCTYVTVSFLSGSRIVTHYLIWAYKLREMSKAGSERLEAPPGGAGGLGQLD